MRQTSAGPRPRASITRREFAGFSAAALAAAAPACRRAAGGRPNILFALADDLSWAHVSAAGDRIVRTPHFDRIAREGVRFTHSFAACPSCSPSRTSILTGREMWQVEEGGNLHSTLNPRYVPYPHLLEDAGYHAGFTGKPWAPGTWEAGGMKRHPVGREFNSRQRAEIPSAGLWNGDYAANFRDFLAARPPGAPFCFWFGCREPHRDYEKGYGLRTGKRLEDVAVPPFLPDTDEVRGDLLDYYAEVEWFDRELGRLLAVLEESGELDNTLVVATGDNGFPFPRAKSNLYDWGTRMPLAIRWPKRIPGGRVVDDFVSHIDFAPTFLEAAGLPPHPQAAGRSLLPLLESRRSGTSEPGRDAVFTGLERHTWCRPEGAGYPMRAIRTRDFLYIRNFAPDRWPAGDPDFVSSNRTPYGDIDAGPTKAFMEGHTTGEYAHLFQMAFGKRPAEELYDLGRDPAQVRNVAGDPAYGDARSRLRTRLESYLKQTGDPRMEGRDPWQGYVYHQTEGFGSSFNRSLPEEVRRKAREKGAAPSEPYSTR